MPRPRRGAKAVEPEKTVEPEIPVEPEEQVDLDGDNDAEEAMEEEVEYEEVEEEVEEEEEEEVEEEEEGEEEEEEEGADEEASDGDQDMKAEDEEETKKHAELLALPPHGSEVYVGGLPRDASEDDLREFCESAGEVTEVRMMKGKDSKENKGYAFVTYRTKDMAAKAIEDLNDTEFQGKKIKCSTSQAKHKLFIGNIPKSWQEEDLKKTVTEIGPGVEVVELLKDPQNSSRNRGFGFIEYYNHACAEYARQKMSNPKFRLDKNAPTVSWADPKNADSSASSQVKAVYVKNLPKNVSQDQLKELFEHHGEITKVVLPPAKPGQEKNRFGFVHFAERSFALKALTKTEKYELDGRILECSLAKPQNDGKGDGAQKSNLLPSYPPRMGYGLGGGAYGGVGAGYGAGGFAQSMIYGRGPTPSGMAMMPMLLPDGRVGYVLQQPGVQAHTPPPAQRNGRSGGGSSGGRRNSDSGRGQRYRPY